MDYIQIGKDYIMNTYSRFPLVLVRGKGAVVYDDQGREYLDFVAGIAVNNLGHCHPSVVAAIKEQVENMIHCSNLYWNAPQAELARLLVENSFGDKVFFCNSGTEANEASIKLVRKYSKENYGENRYGIITMHQSFHGRTLGSLTATGQTKYHNGFAPLVEGFKYVPFNDIRALEAAIDENTCAVMLEPIQGEGGVYEVQENYLYQVRKLCDEKGLLLIFDEVQCGMGRSGKLFAYQHYGVQPDIMTLAKAIAGGLPLGAMIATDKVASAFKPGDHASTFGGNPVACAAGVAVMKELLGGVIDNAREMGDYLKAGLLQLKQIHPVISEIRGKGLMIGVEFNMQEVTGIVNKAMQKGLLLLSAGHRVVRMVPPLIITRTEIDKAIDVLDDVLKEMGV
ncbi:acetylornithine transaminase [Calorimonas adulescens]|jgi:acetylornithine and succinylornithine aminotransferases|uniref:Acetylornithine aminotransferase n=1 Tax=Calorimonas adulescens TaxID=2606906 RepID=A0A5D8QGG8_9THEO|nr:acetylornithine transaminase [Calorimonas adulescens]TZE83622.1 acetylornithine transaminase [Calorimonas adulescens]